MASKTAAEEVAAKPKARRRRSGEAIAPIEYHLLMLVTLALVAFGLIMVYSASSGTAVLFGRDPVSVLLKQGIYAALGIAVMAALARTPYRRLRWWAVPLLVVIVGLLVLVLIPGVGAEINNARRWLLLGPISIQPSEFAKAIVLLFAAAVLASRRRAPQTLGELLNPVGVVVLVVCALVKIEPDLGTTIAIVLMVCGVLIVAGTPFRLFLSVTIPALVVDHLHGDPRAVPDAANHHVPGSAEGSAGDGLPGDPGDVRPRQRRLDRCRTGQRDAEGLHAGGLDRHDRLGDRRGAWASRDPRHRAAFAAFAVLGFRIAMRCKDPFGKYLVAGGHLPDRGPGVRQPRRRARRRCR